MPYQSRHTGTLADLMLRQGDLAADRAARSGQMWGNVARGVASIPAGIQQRKAAERAAQIEEAQIASRLETDALTRQNIQSQIDERGNARMDKAAEKDEAETAKRGAAWLVEVATAPDLESKRMAWKVGRDALIAEGRLQPSEAPEFFPGDSWLKLSVAQKYPELGKAMFPEPKGLINVPVGGAVLDPETRQPVFTNPRPPEAPPNPTTAALAAAAAKGDKDAIEALRLLREQNPPPQRAGSGLTPNMEANVIRQLATQWTTASKPARDLERQVSLMDAGIAAARRGDLAQGAQAVLVTFQKILDPTSVVRESEFDRSAAGQSLMNRVRGAAERMSVGGAGVPLPELEKFAALAKEAANAQRGAYLDGVKNRLRMTAGRYQIPEELIFESLPTTAGTVRARDPQGKLHEAPEGTPLPSGWTLEP